MDQPGIRLNKFLATHLGIGRRPADDLIAAGRVRLNDAAPQLGARVMPNDKVEVEGKVIDTSKKPDYTYIMMNKPKGYVCSKRQQGDTPTIYSLLPAEYQNLKTVGRLDKDSSGLILLTNDGDFAHQQTHPTFAKVKKYEVELNKPLEPLHHQIINDRGVNLPDGLSKMGLEKMADDPTRWRITMYEGRNRQIRRTFNALGYTVLRLHRTDFGNFALSSLQPGELMQVTVG